MKNLIEMFHHYFEVVSAETLELLDAAFQLRYQVYCVENDFEDTGHFPDGREYDEFDRRSVHTLVRHRNSGHVAGVVRLVLPELENSNEPFPIEEHFPEVFKCCDNELESVPRDSLAEISRFSVSSEFKRRVAESRTLSGVSENVKYIDIFQNGYDHRRILPHITLGLFAGIVRMSAENNITHWLVVMEPSLIRLLERFSIHFNPIGPIVDFHGKRQPAIAAVDDVLSSMHINRRDVWEIITDNGRIWPLSASAIDSVS